MTIDYKKLTDIMLTLAWPRFVKLTEQHVKETNLRHKINEVAWEAVTKPGLFTIGLFFISTLLKNEEGKEIIIFYIIIKEQNIELRLQFDASNRTLDEVLAFIPTLTDSHRFNGESLENVGGDWEKWLTWAENEKNTKKLSTY